MGQVTEAWWLLLFKLFLVAIRSCYYDSSGRANVIRVNHKASDIRGVRWLFSFHCPTLQMSQALTGVLTWTAESRLLVTAAFPKACLAGGGIAKVITLVTSGGGGQRGLGLGVVTEGILKY